MALPLRSEGLIGGCPQLNGCSPGPGTVAGPPSSGPTRDLEDGVCVRGAGLKDRTQDGGLGGDSETPLPQMPGTARDTGVRACVQRSRER